MVRRMLLVLTVALVVAAMTAATAAPAFAQASQNASCVGQDITFLNQLGKARGLPGFGGRVAALTAQDLGDLGGPGLSGVATFDRRHC